jgi:hypothetical protein
MANSFKAPERQRIPDAPAPANHQVRADIRDDVDRASFDSFPASDPPSWNGVRLGSPCDTCGPSGKPDDAAQGR